MFCFVIGGLYRNLYALKRNIFQLNSSFGYQVQIKYMLYIDTVSIGGLPQDVGENANVTYQFGDSMEYDKFRMDALTGDIVLVGPLDREDRDEYLLKVVATDGAWRTETNVGITVQDVNDNKPVFAEADYLFMVPASTSNIAVIGRVIATDQDDLGPNSKIVYSFRESSEFFSIDSTSGEILTRKKLDNHLTTRTRTVENEYLLQVNAEDNGQPPLRSTCQVKILLVDENLHPPQFTKRDYTIPIPAAAQPGLQVVQVNAVDTLDTGLNSEVKYIIKPSQDSANFGIDSSTGMISLKNRIENRAYMLTVVAQDKGVPTLSDSVIVNIMPSGVNQYSPVFSVSNTQIIIPEDRPVGSSIIQLSATDRDEGINGMIRYGILGGNQADMFDVNEQSGEILIKKPLDYDIESRFVLIVEARDLGYSSRAANATLNIKLTDVNDNIPFFKQNQYDAYLEENKPAGSSVITMHAVDIDSSRYGKVVYTIVDPGMKDFFEIDSATGLVRSVAVFDYEVSTEYRMEVTATNRENQRSVAGANSTVLVVHITGANEFYPR